jgi:antitoxin (DNA-binding transcriptional repressor) of toxin-antitoxin stability system
MRAHLSRLVAHVQAGEEIIIARNGKNFIAYGCLQEENPRSERHEAGRGR